MDYDEQGLRTDTNEVVYKDEVLSRGVLSFPIDDKDLLRVVEMKLQEAANRLDELNIGKRRKLLRDYWKGKQIDYKMFYEWQVPYVDNVIYRDVETMIPIAVSRVPNVIVTPNGDDPKKRGRANAIQRVLDTQLRSRHIRKVLRNMVRHVLLDFVGIIKVRWDVDQGKAVFERVDPNKVILDPNASPTDFGLSSESHDIIAEWIEEPLKVVISKFPSKKSEIFDRVGERGIKQGNERQMASKIRYMEIWYTWYDDKGRSHEGVCWKLKDLILGKLKNPYFDYEGREEVIGVDPVTDDTVTQRHFYNYFKKPMKPYIICNYQNMGESPFDDTTPVEQAIPLQDVVNKRGRQITELADKANPKKVFSQEFISKEDAAKVTDDPNESIWGSGPLSEGFTYVPGIPPNPVLFQDLVQNRMELDNILGTHSTTRGERTSEESGVSRQIMREGDFGRIDDMVMEVVEPAADEMSQWTIQMMKVFATKQTFMEVLGQSGESEFVEFDRDSIDDGINVMVKASTVDKTERKQTAAQLASAGMIDPLSLYEDLDAFNARERAKRMIMLKADPTGALYLQHILADQEAAAQVTTATQQAALLENPAMAAAAMSPEGAEQPAEEPTVPMPATPVV